ncbi:hypothetical protein ACFLTK_02730 [Chloroflexota bacterium]
MNGEGRAILSGCGTEAFVTMASELLSDRCRNNIYQSCREFADMCEDVVNDIFKRYVMDKCKALGMTKAGGKTANKNIQ